MYNILPVLDEFLPAIKGIFVDCFRILDSIRFTTRFSLLDLILSLLVIFAFIPIVLSFAKGGVRSSRSGYRTRVRSSRRHNEGGDN